MNIKSQRFGAIEVAEDQVINFAEGIIGFPEEKSFVLIPHNSAGFLAWLQSAKTPAVALPVVSAHAFGGRYPDVDVTEIAKAHGLGGPSEDVALMVVLCAPHNSPATVNLLAPILVNVATRRGAQVILEGSSFSTRELFVREQELDASKAQAAAE